MIKFTGNSRRDFDRLSEEYTKQKDRILEYQEQIRSLQQSLKGSETARERQKEDYEALLREKDAVIAELSNQLAHMKAVADHDGTNTGMPTSGTPINKKKVIPNSRRSSGKKKGGQPGHEKHALPAFPDAEVNETVPHVLDLETTVCGTCGGRLVDTGRTEQKDEFEVEIKVVKRRHIYKIYECEDCGQTWRAQIDGNLKEQNQYGSFVQALALSLMLTGNVAINKVCMLLSGMTGGEVMPSEGFVCKLYRRASEGLAAFREQLRRVMLCRTLLYWDDTVVMVNTERACMRFYGDETISYYTAHMTKGLDGIREDNILGLLTGETSVMHDHNRVNYNPEFHFQNLECNQHLQRDLQKIADDCPAHTWSAGLKKFLSETIKARKDHLLEGITEFASGKIKQFHKKVEGFLRKGEKENEESPNPYSTPFEKTVIKRIRNYEENYFKWVEDFTLPTTDNLSERGLRGIKSHMKISGQFANEKTARYYADVKTYVETCRKNGINEMMALSRLCSGNPLSVDEIFS